MGGSFSQSNVPRAIPRLTTDAPNNRKRVLEIFITTGGDRSTVSKRNEFYRLISRLCRGARDCRVKKLHHWPTCIGDTLKAQTANVHQGFSTVGDSLVPDAIALRISPIRGLCFWLPIGLLGLQPIFPSRQAVRILFNGFSILARPKKNYPDGWFRARDAISFKTSFSCHLSP